jgi:hypothetical protein
MIPEATASDTPARLPVPIRNPVAVDGIAGPITPAVASVVEFTMLLTSPTCPTRAVDADMKACAGAVTVMVCGAAVTLMKAVVVAVGVSLPRLSRSSP